MFRPNNTCTLFQPVRVNGGIQYDIRGEVAYPGLGETVKCSIISLDLALDSSSVRVDQSPTRGKAEELAGDAIILFSASTPVFEKDFVIADGKELEVIAVFPRRTVRGTLHHYEAVLRKAEKP